MRFEYTCPGCGVKCQLKVERLAAALANGVQHGLGPDACFYLGKLSGQDQIRAQEMLLESISMHQEVFEEADGKYESKSKAAALREVCPASKIGPL